MQRYWTSERACFRSSCASYWENRHSFLEKIYRPAAKRVGAALLEFAVPEVADVVSGKENFRTAAKSVGRQTLRKQLGGGKQKRSIPVKILKEAVRHVETFLLILQINKDRSQ